MEDKNYRQAFSLSIEKFPFLFIPLGDFYLPPSPQFAYMLKPFFKTNQKHHLVNFAWSWELSRIGCAQFLDGGISRKSQRLLAGLGIEKQPPICQEGRMIELSKKTFRSKSMELPKQSPQLLTGVSESKKSRWWLWLSWLIWHPTPPYPHSIDILQGQFP